MFGMFFEEVNATIVNSVAAGILDAVLYTFAIIFVTAFIIVFIKAILEAY